MLSNSIYDNYNNYNLFLQINAIVDYFVIIVYFHSPFCAFNYTLIINLSEFHTVIVKEVVVGTE